ncbi:MAG: histone deacetylase [Deltaproteobacteria bacterium]|nr:histone deacetylase [Deltaproteobacteria bacterium]
MSKTGIIWDSRFLKHDTGKGHPECPRRLLAIKEVLDTDSTLIRLVPRAATEEEIGWVHSKEHIENVKKTANADHGYFDLDTPFGSGSSESAFLAVGGLLEAVESVWTKKVDNAFAFPRPPGHHAESTRAMGFCLFNNIAVAAEYLVRQKGLKRVAIVDIDVHHGNGTQHFFYDRDDVFYISTHRFPFYPGTGAAHETGEGKGKGYTLNLPFDALGDDDDYKKGYDEKILPALHEYRPEFVLVSAGFDAHKRDPLGGMKITKGGFKMMARNLLDVAQKYAGGATGAKIVFVLEGGYDMKGLQEGVEAILEVIHG